MGKIFKESLDGAAAVLREQLEMAKAKKYSVQVRGFWRSSTQLLDTGCIKLIVLTDILGRKSYS